MQAMPGSQRLDRPESVAIARPIRRFGGLLTSEVIWGRAFPAFFFQLWLLARASGVVQRLEGSPASLAMSPWLLEQALAMLFATFNVVLFVVRRPVVGQRSSLLGAVVAIAGTFAINAPVGARVVEDNPIRLLASSALILVGMLWAIASLAFLGRCFGLFPEARGLVTRGPYRWIRHPLYLGELTAALGLVVATASPAFFALYLAVCGLQYWRARLEERALSRVFPEYAAYRRRTYRILPGIH